MQTNPFKAQTKLTTQKNGDENYLGIINDDDDDDEDDN